MKIKAVVMFEATEDEVGIYIDSDNLVGEMVQVKTGEYDNLLMGVIVSVEDV